MDQTNFRKICLNLVADFRKHLGGYWTLLAGDVIFDRRHS